MFRLNVNKARMLISSLSLLALLVCLLVQNQAVSFAAAALCAFVCIFVFYRHLPQLSGVSPQNPKARTLRAITVVNGLLVLGCILFVVLQQAGLIALSDKQASWLLCGLFAFFILGFGNVAPKLPFNRYAGLRLPWTVRDEDTWIVAHRILGYASLPCGLLCFAGVGNLQTAAHFSVSMLLVWILIPAVLSYLFFRKKWTP